MPPQGVHNGAISFERLLGRSVDPTTVHASIALRLETAAHGEGWHGALDLLDPQGTLVQREVRSGDCREAFDALALMVAVALDAGGTSPPSLSFSSEDESAVPTDEDGGTASFWQPIASMATTDPLM